MDRICFMLYIATNARKEETLLSFIYEIVLNQTGNHAFVVDNQDNQWFCRYIRKPEQEVESYLLDVFLYFIHDRCRYFDCDAA